MSNRIAVLFRRSLITQGTNQDNVNYYMLSVRDERYLRPNINIQTELVKSYENCASIPWVRSMDLNIDDKLLNLTINSNIFQKLFYIEIFSNMNLMLWTRNMSQPLVDKAVALDISTKKVVYNAHPSLKLPQIAMCYELKTSRELVELLWPDYVGNLINAVGIGVYPFSKHMLDEVENCDIDERFNNYNNLNTTNKPLLSSVELLKNWQYTLALDVSKYDSPDLFYTIPASYAEQFEWWIADAVEQEGYRLYILPMYENIIKNWIGYGILPILVDEGVR